MGKNSLTAILLIVCLLVAAPIYIITESMLFSMFVGLVAVIITYLIIRFVEKIVQKYRENAINTKAVMKISLTILAIIIVIVGIIAIFRACAPEASPKCLKCGRNAMFTESGYCYRCYKEAEDAVKDAYDKYYD